MERRDTSSQRGLLTFVWAPLAAVAAIGSVATMIGRPKTTKRRTRPSQVAGALNDPRINKAVETAQRALDEARQALDTRDGGRIQEQLVHRTGAALGSASETMSPLMKDAGERARELAERIVVEGQARSADLSQLIRDDVAPKAKTYAQEAIDEAEVILANARERATELSRNARRDYGPEVSKKANALAGLVAAGSATGFQILRERAGEISSQSKGKRGRSVSQRGKQKAAAVAQAAGSQARYVAAESIMVGFWATALGATIYFAILTRDQRERLKGFFENAFSQIHDVMSDFQGGDEEFQNVTR